MKTLRFGDSGAPVELLQLALYRAGDYAGEISGNFCQDTRLALCRFQCRTGLIPDAAAGPQTHKALQPYYTGFRTHIALDGDSLHTIAQRYGAAYSAVRTANPQLADCEIASGTIVIVPLTFPVIPTNISICGTGLTYFIRGLAARYPFLRISEAGRSVLGQPVYIIGMGRGDKSVFYNASHHANEWITTLILLRFTEEFAEAFAQCKKLSGYSPLSILERTRINIAPCVNPDGVDLVTRALTSGSAYDAARKMARCYPVPFPEGWKANINGVDLNLQYPAGWEQARINKFRSGYRCRGPRDYVGSYPLCEPESRAMYEFTLDTDPSMVLAYHSQGRVIYWKYLNLEPPGSYETALRFGKLSGYTVEETPYASGFAGYKDWFINEYNRPGYTIEVGSGTSPLPLSDFPEIYKENLGILLDAAHMVSS